MNRLEKLREEHGLKKSETARAVGLPYTTYIAYEKGERGLNQKMLKLFADYYGVSFDYLLGNTDEKNPTAESSGSDEPIDELEAYARSLFSQLTIKDKIDVINQLQSRLQQQSVQGVPKESD